MHLRSFLITGYVLVLFAASGRAGGSITFQDDALPLLRKQPALLQFIQSTLDVAPGGSGWRFGPHGVAPARAGERVSPFSFEAKPKGQAGPYTLLLIINEPNSGVYVDGEPSVAYIKVVPLPKVDAK